MNSIKNIIFDLGGVFLKGKPANVLDSLEIDSGTYSILNTFFEDWKKLDLGNETLEEKYNKCNFPIEYDKLYKEYLIHYYKYRAINMDLINLITKLRENNYRIYILSDNNRECFNYCKDNQLFKNVDGWILSCEYNTLKDDNLFDVMIKKYNLNVEECYFVDDSSININVAKKYGIKGFIFNGTEDINILCDNMRKNGIDV